MRHELFYLSWYWNLMHRIRSTFLIFFLLAELAWGAIPVHPKLNHVLEFNNGGAVSCSDINTFSFDVINPTTKPLRVVFTEDWLGTKKTSITTMTKEGKKTFAVRGLFSGRSQFASLIPFAYWNVPPGQHQVTVNYECEGKGFIDMKLMGLHVYLKSSIIAFAQYVSMGVSFFALGIYAAAFWVFSRRRTFLIFSGLSIVTAFTALTYLLNSGTSILFIEDFPWVEREFTFFSNLTIVLICQFLQGRCREKKLNDNSFKIVKWLGLAAIPFGFWLDHLGLFFVHHVSSLIFILALSYFCYSKHLILQACNMLSLAICSILSYSYLFGAFGKDSIFIWALPVGLLLSNLIMMGGFLFDAYNAYQKGILERRKKNDMERTLQIANDLQNKFMGSDQSENIYSYYQPAENIGGDWFKYFSPPQTNILYLFIGDVTGHGVESAHMTALVAGAMNEIKRDLSRSSEIDKNTLIESVKYFNHLFYCEGSKYDLSMTMLAIGIDKGTGETCVVNISHSHPLVIGSKGLRPLVSTNPYLGRSEDFEPNISNFNLVDGDQLFLYTDGLLENGSKETRVSTRTFRKHLKYENSIKENGDFLNAQCQNWVEDFNDDVTYLIYSHSSS